MAYLDAFEKQTNLIKKLGTENAYTSWVMSQYLEDSDAEALASVALTDGPDDKKIDFIHIDHDSKRIVFAQGFFQRSIKMRRQRTKHPILTQHAHGYFPATSV